MFTLSTPLGALFIVAPSVILIWVLAWAVVNRWKVAKWARMLWSNFSKEQAAQKEEYKSTWD